MQVVESFAYFKVLSSATMKVVIPSCGKGERFRAVGYDTIKPLINVYGVPMIDRVVQSLKLRNKLDAYFVVVNFDASLLNHPFVQLDRPTLGAAETVLLALQASNEDDASLLLVDCDAIYHTDIIQQFASLEARPDIRAAVLSFREQEPDTDATPKYSYVQTDESGAVSKIAEKERVGPLANTGAYWFASTSEFMQTAQQVVAKRQFQHGEAYVSTVLDEYLKDGKVVQTVIIREDEYSNLGTPESLENYLSSSKWRAFLFDLDGTIVDTTAAYVQTWNSLLASKGAFVDSDFFNAHISGLSDEQVRQNLKISISSTDKDAIFLQHLNLVQEIPGAVEFVRRCQNIGLVHVVTNSNKIAAAALLRRMGLDDIPLLTADDVENGKPNPEPYLKAMLALGVSPRLCTAFEDSKGGVSSARAAGAGSVIAISNNMSTCDAFYKTFENIQPGEILEHLESVEHLSNELTQMFGQRSTVFPVRASGGYISEILSASSGARKLVVKLENSDHGVLQEVSEHLGLHKTECNFYLSLASTAPVRTPAFYGVLPVSQAIVMEDLRKFDRAPDFSLASGLKVVHASARLHSHFRGANLDKLSSHAPYMRQHVFAHYQLFKQKWSQTLSAEVFALFDHAAHLYQEAETHLLTSPCTLLHGDLKFPNLFWDSATNGGEPIFIDWQYAGPGQGVEDIVFLLVESCGVANFKLLAESLIHSYYEERQKLDDIEISQSERRVQISCALAGFPLFVAIWFGCIDASKLTDPNFPFLYIIRLANAFIQLYDKDWPRYKPNLAR